MLDGSKVVVTVEFRMQDDQLSKRVVEVPLYGGCRAAYELAALLSTVSVASTKALLQQLDIKMDHEFPMQTRRQYEATLVEDDNA